MAGTRLLERLTASDRFLLLWDDYGWSTDIGGLAILDGVGPEDHGRQRPPVRLTADRDRLLAGSQDLQRPEHPEQHRGLPLADVFAPFMMRH